MEEMPYDGVVDLKIKMEDALDTNSIKREASDEDDFQW